jgi:hypothetical protein
MTFYHGTSIQGLTKILPPTETSILREDFRKKFLDCVFITPLKKSAEMYARKCASKLGGTAIVYEVRPVNPININTSQYVCEKAYVVKSYTLVEK